MPTLPIHPAEFGDKGDLPVVGEVNTPEVATTPVSTCVEDLDGLESESFDLRRRLAFGDKGEPICTASARAPCLASAMIGSSSTGSSSDNADVSEEAEDWDSR